MLGFTRNIGSSSVLMVELRVSLQVFHLLGIMVFITLSWNAILAQLYIQSPEGAIRIILIVIWWSKSPSFLIGIRTLRSPMWLGRATVQQINQQTWVTPRVLDSLPSCCGAMLNEDTYGVSFLRRFLVSYGPGALHVNKKKKIKTTLIKKYKEHQCNISFFHKIPHVPCRI